MRFDVFMPDTEQMSTRRRAMLVAGIAMLTPQWLSAAQPAAKRARIGILSPFSAGTDPFREAVEQRLHELGYDNGRGAEVEYRSAAGAAGRLPQLATELVTLKVD